MKSALPVVSLVFLGLSSAAGAQPPAPSGSSAVHSSSGFGFIAFDRDHGCPWADCGPMYTEGLKGGGWELRAPSGISFTAEATIRHDRVLVSPNLSYHVFRTPRSGVDPFVTGGLSMEMGAGDRGIGVDKSGLNFGAGTNVWLSDHVGARVEWRNYDSSLQWSERPLSEFRIGFVIR